MILTTENLASTLRKKCDQAKKRIWIVSPFIGGFSKVQKIIGGQWMKQSVDFRVITDNNSGFIKQDTFDEFVQFGEVRSLRSVHAKIYIIDDWCLITSANLTGTAFSRRHEVGTILENESIKDTIKVFDEWWKKSKKIRTVKSPPSNIDNIQDGNSKAFPKIIDLPEYDAFDEYSAKCDMYYHFSQEYKRVTGCVKCFKGKGYTLYQEIDLFFNYLFHDHANTPSVNITQVVNLTPKQREDKIEQYFTAFENYCKKDDSHMIDKKWRSDTVKKLLAKENIGKLKKNQIKKVVSCIYALNGIPLNRIKFLNTKNNTLKSIRKYWDLLLHCDELNQTIIDTVDEGLISFSTSSIQELIGWYYPEKYPLMNTNSNSGMRFFGYDIKD